MKNNIVIKGSIGLAFIGIAWNSALLVNIAGFFLFGNAAAEAYYYFKYE